MKGKIKSPTHFLVLKPALKWVLCILLLSGGKAEFRCRIVAQFEFCPQQSVAGSNAISSPRRFASFLVEIPLGCAVKRREKGEGKTWSVVCGCFCLFSQKTPFGASFEHFDLILLPPYT